MKNQSKNISIVTSLILLGYILSDIVNSVGEIPECRTEPYSNWDMLLALLFIVMIYALGYTSKK